MSSIHPNYNILAGRLIISNHQKSTSASLVKKIKKLHNNVDSESNTNQLVSSE